MISKALNCVFEEVDVRAQGVSHRGFGKRALPNHGMQDLSLSGISDTFSGLQVDECIGDLAESSPHCPKLSAWLDDESRNEPRIPCSHPGLNLCNLLAEEGFQ